MIIFLFYLSYTEAWANEPTSSSNEPEILDLTYITFDGTVSVDHLLRSNGCDKSEDNVPILCRPNPYAAVCKADKNQVQKEISEKYVSTSPDRYKVFNQRMKKAGDLFIQVLNRSTTLRPIEKSAIGSAVRRCSEKISWGGGSSGSYNGYNATMSNLRREISSNNFLKENTAPNLLEAALSESCEIRIANDTEYACLLDEPVCYQTLFHEFGHLLNSCLFISIDEAFYRFSELDPHPQDVMQKRERENPNMARLARRALKLGNELIEDYSCLGNLSHPQSAIPNRCSSRYSDSIRAHCDPNVFAGVPRALPEWDEAEADFWAASAFALWLEQQSPDPAQRRTIALRMVASTCATNKQKAREERLSQIYTEPESNGGCYSQPKAGYAESAPVRSKKDLTDVHQDWATRINYNYLRNSDFRRTIGCALSLEIPLSCSPRGSRTTLILK